MHDDVIDLWAWHCICSGIATCHQGQLGLNQPRQLDIIAKATPAKIQLQVSKQVQPVIMLVCAIKECDKLCYHQYQYEYVSVAISVQCIIAIKRLLLNAAYVLLYTFLKTFLRWLFSPRNTCKNTTTGMQVWPVIMLVFIIKGNVINNVITIVSV